MAVSYPLCNNSQHPQVSLQNQGRPIALHTRQEQQQQPAGRRKRGLLFGLVFSPYSFVAIEKYNIANRMSPSDTKKQAYFP